MKTERHAIASVDLLSAYLPSEEARSALSWRVEWFGASAEEMAAHLPLAAPIAARGFHVVPDAPPVFLPSVTSRRATLVRVLLLGLLVSAFTLALSLVAWDGIARAWAMLFHIAAFLGLWGVALRLSRTRPPQG